MGVTDVLSFLVVVRKERDFHTCYNVHFFLGGGGSVLVWASVLLLSRGRSVS
jgi:hypothetical protein